MYSAGFICCTHQSLPPPVTAKRHISQFTPKYDKTQKHLKYTATAHRNVG